MSPYDLRNNNSFKRIRVNSVQHGNEWVSYLGPKIWDLVLNEIKESESLNAFKFKIKRWVPEGYPYRICKIYLRQVGCYMLSLLSLYTSVLPFLTNL